MTTTRTPKIVEAVLAGDSSETKRCLDAGDSPDCVWGDYPLITHAALQMDSDTFSLLIERGASIPDSILSDIITWEVGDWRINSEDEEQRLADIVFCLRQTNAWPSLDVRRSLVDRLDGYQLPILIQALTDDTTEAEQGAAGNR